MGELQNQFSWSRSRDNAFRDCRRRYWIHYYGSWGGWERDAPTSVRQAYLLAGTSALRDGPLQRCFRDMHAGSQHFFASPIATFDYARDIMNAASEAAIDA